MLWEHEVAGSNPVAPTRDFVEAISETSGFWSVFFLLLIVAIQLGAAIGFVWLVARFATRKTAAKTDTRLQDLEQRIARIERSTPPESDTG